MTYSLFHRFRLFGLLSLSAFALSALSGCNSVAHHTVNTSNPALKQETSALTPAMQAAVGDYASEDYKSRAQGYDWVGVMVRADGNEQIDVKVRARSDLKKPTCQFDGKATLMGQDEAHGVIFQTKVNDKQVFFQFKDSTLTIDGPEPAALSYFCSGGASLAGEYQKLAGQLELNAPRQP